MKQGELREIPLDQILDPESPIRDDLGPETLVDLAKSIKQIGIIEPLIVRRKGEQYEVIAGHRRLKAAELIGESFAPCIIVDVRGDEIEVVKLHENLARAEISPVQLAKHLQRIKQHYGTTTANIAAMLGMSESWVHQYLKLLEWDAHIVEAMKNNQITFSSARELAAINDEKTRRYYLTYAIKSGITPAQAAKWRKQANASKQPVNTQTQSVTNNYEEPQVEQTQSTCPVCGEAIPLEEEITIRIHDGCRPT